MRRYTVIIERGPTSYGAYVPDLPGCIAAGETREEVEQLIRAAIEEHLELLRASGDPIPEPTSAAIVIDAAIAFPGLPHERAEFQFFPSLTKSLGRRARLRRIDSARARDQPGHRPAMTGDDNFLSSLDPIQESAERILGMEQFSGRRTLFSPMTKVLDHY